MTYLDKCAEKHGCNIQLTLGWTALITILVSFNTFGDQSKVFFNFGVAIFGIALGFSKLYKLWQRPAKSVVQFAIAYIWISVTWGSVYYIVFVTKPPSFLIDDAMFKAAQASEINRRHTNIEQALATIQLLDSALTTITITTDSTLELFTSNGIKFNHENTGWRIRYSEGITGFSSVNGGHKTYSLTLIPTAQETRITDHISISKLEIKNNNFSALRTWLTDQFLRVRVNYVQEIYRNSPGDKMRTQFNILDFMYFAAMAPGADIVKPARTWTRLLVLSQYIYLVALAFREDPDNNPKLSQKRDEAKIQP